MQRNGRESCFDPRSQRYRETDAGRVCCDAEKREHIKPDDTEISARFAPNHTEDQTRSVLRHRESPQTIQRFRRGTPI